MNIDIDITDVVLKTERLTLRPWKQSDLEDFYEYASVDGVGQMAGWKPHENREVSQRILTDFIAGKKTFAVVYEGKAIGSVGIEKYKEKEAPEYDTLRCRELGAVLGKPYWGKGIMPEALNEVIRYCFEDLKLDAVFAGYFKWNKQSERLQEKCGFHFYKVIQYETRLETMEETNLNVLTYKEWKETH